MNAKTKTIANEAAETNNLVSLAAVRNKKSQRKIDGLISSIREVARERADTDMAAFKPLSQQELIAMFRNRSHGPKKMTDSVLRSDVRPGMIVGMTRAQSEAFDNGLMAEVLPFKKGN